MVETASHSSVPAAASEPTLRAVLVLDLADSTALVDRLGDQRTAELMRRHDRLARDLIHKHRGQEIDKTDGFLLLFERPVQAVGFALEYQRRLGELAELEATPMAARIGIHVGEVVSWENSPAEIARGAKPIEVEGLAKPVAARLMALAWPGQILLSAMAYGLAQRAEAELRTAGRLPLWKQHGNYRFKGVSELMAVYEAGETDVAPFRAPGSGNKAQRVLPWWRRPAAIAGEVVGLIAVVALLGFLTFKSEPGIAFVARDWVVVGDLVNRTGQTLLDDSLDLAFRQGLSQSRHVNVLSSLQVRDALTRMQRDATATKVDRSIGAELAQRERARALLLPSVADTGGAFRLSVEVVDPATQATIWVASENARQPEDLLPAMDRVIEGLREKLGESLPSIEADSVPLAKATTSNLEALRTYSIARKQYELTKYDDARRLFERAIEMDPEFAMAYAGIAATYAPVGRYAEAVPPARRAAALRDRMSQREAIYIDAMLAWAEDPERSVDRWTDFANLYPDLGSGDNNAALVLWQDLNRCPEAIPMFKRAFASRDPLRFFSGHCLGYCQLWDGKPELAEESFRAALQVNPRPMTFGLSDTYTYLERFDAAEAVLDADRAGLPPQFALEADARRVTWLAYQGRLEDAHLVAQKLGAAAQSAAVPATASRARIYEAALALHTGRVIPLADFAERERALLGAQESAQYPVSLHLALLALIAERQGLDADARGWVAEIRAHPSGRKNPSLQALLTVLDARLDASPAAALAAMQLDAAANDYMQAHVAAADLARESGSPQIEAEQLRWLDLQRGRAFAEYSGFFAAQTLNVLDVNRALLREIEIETDPARRAALRERLDQRWKDADPNVRSQIPPAAVAEPG